ncbi:hypothetical protein BJX61DRAFT_532194 [Aspergillus egyptiacus]|nr:hypothetical protein BJX61DRAFT_532194 [Aspergillus egyptiacus]
MMKTYGRSPWRVYDDDQRPAAKKRRVLSDNESDAAEKSLQYAIRESTAVVRSSPSRRNSLAFSDGSQEDDLSTPPSSPPPRLSPPPPNTRKPAFSFLKRKHSTAKEATNGSPLSEVNSNSVRASLDPPKKKGGTPSSQQQPALKQMQLDLGHEVRKTCATCGMEYVPSNTEDASLHKKYHDMNSTGVDLGKAFGRANASRWVYEATRFDEGYVVIIDRKASPTAKNQAKKVLEVISKELSSPVIEDEVLWSQTEPPKHLRKNGDAEKVDRYKVFLHMKNNHCVGACLTERIWESHLVDKASFQQDGIDAAVTVGNDTHPAIVGISRIWTSGASRRKGIAMDLLDCVEQVAFSQPTNSGKSLARAFFGPENEQTSSQSASPPSPDPDHVFLSHLPPSAPAASQTNLPSSPSAIAITIPPPVISPGPDDYVISDDQSTSDPFNRDSDVSENEAERAQPTTEGPMTASPGGLRLKHTIQTTPPTVSLSLNHAPSTATTPLEHQGSRTGGREHSDSNETLWESTKIAHSFVPRQSPDSSEVTDSDSNHDESRPYARRKISGRPLSIGPGVDLEPLPSRQGKDRVPPPLPKSHHGKLISSDLSVTPPSSPPTPGKAASRASFHGFSLGASVSSRLAQSDYFSTPSEQSALPTDVIRRSQSQHKRPPTPPLSRRLGRSSKSTFSKPAPSQLSLPHVRADATASVPSSPGSLSSTPLRNRDSRPKSSFSDEASSILTIRSENIPPRDSVDVPASGFQFNPRRAPKRAYLVNHLPPPPPPRRSRGRNHSKDSSSPASLRSEQPLEEREKHDPNSSNAKDILADLSRLQKEVDDLRGRYENRRSE